MSDPFRTICYKKNFLREVIARVDLLTPLPGAETSLPKDLIDVAVKAFPIPEPGESVHNAVQISPGGVASSQERHKEWRFLGKERTKTLTVGRDVIVVQYTTYQTYELVRDEFLEILECVAELFDEVQCQRVGLRFVNEVELEEGSPLDWSTYLAPKLLSLFQFPSKADSEALARVFHNVEWALDDFNLSYRFGMPNPDYPARIRQKLFVLDLDAYANYAIDLRQAGRLLDDFHTTIQRYFEKSITKNLRSLMDAD